MYKCTTVNQTAFYPNSGTCLLPLFSFADADQAECKDTSLSTTRILVAVNIAPEFWTFERQSIITISSPEAQQVVFSACAKQVVSLRRILLELSGKPIYEDQEIYPIERFTDSTAAISLTKNSQVFERNKPTKIKIHHLKELREQRLVYLKYVRTEKQPAYMLTRNASHCVFKNIFLLSNA